MTTIHLPQNVTLPEIRRVLELIQKQTSTKVQNVSTEVNKVASGIASSGGGSGSVGPVGPAGPAGASGSIDTSLLVTELVETEDFVLDEAGGFIVDESPLFTDSGGVYTFAFVTTIK